VLVMTSKCLGGVRATPTIIDQRACEPFRYAAIHIGLDLLHLQGTQITGSAHQQHDAAASASLSTDSCCVAKALLVAKPETALLCFMIEGKWESLWRENLSGLCAAHLFRPHPPDSLPSQV
jgi:hypothetical protein